MLKKTVPITMVCVLLLSGCTSMRLAQESLAIGQDSNLEIRNAFLAKSWGLNRALVTESRRGYVAEAKLVLLSIGSNGTVDIQTAMQSLDNLANELATDEITTSENFAYLALLSIMGERADSYLDQTYGFIEAQKPIWMRSALLRSAIMETTTEIEMWTMLLGDVLPKFKGLIDKIPTR